MVKAVFGSIHSPIGGTWGTRMNTPVGIFLEVWRYVFRSGVFRRWKWTVKTEVDTVFLHDPGAMVTEVSLWVTGGVRALLSATNQPRRSVPPVCRIRHEGSPKRARARECLAAST